MLMGPPFIQAVELGRDFLMRLCTRQSSRARGRERERRAPEQLETRTPRHTGADSSTVDCPVARGGGARQAAVVVWLNVLISKNQDNLPERNGARPGLFFPGAHFRSAV